MLTKKDIPLVLSIIILSFIVAQLAVKASYDINDNSTPGDTIIVPPNPTPKETPTPKPVTPAQPVVKETPVEVIEVSQPVPTENREDAFAKAKEKQQLEQSENTEESTPDETVKEPEPQPINVNAVVNQDGYVYVGVENAGRQVTITGE